MKKVISLLLSLVLCLSIIPISAFAAVSDLKINGVEVVNAFGAASTPNPNWSWDAVTRTLTILKDFNTTSPFLFNGDYDITIDLNGHNIVLNGNGTYTSGIIMYADYNLTIAGSGTITCNGTYAGIKQESGLKGLKLKNNAKLICTGGTYGIEYTSVTFIDNSKFDIQGTTKAFDSLAVYIAPSIEYTIIPNSADVYTATRVKTPDDEPEPDPEPYEEIKVTTLINEYLYTGEYGNETVVVDDIRAFDTIFNSHVVNAWSSVYEWTIIPAEVNSVILKNAIHEKLANEDKRVEFVFDRAIVDAEVQKESVYNSLRVTVDEGVAKHWQKKAMDTDCVISEIKVEYNGAYTKNSEDVIIAVPICGENVKVFYLIDDYTIGEIPCKTNVMYCFFNFYKNGTYVICKE